MRNIHQILAGLLAVQAGIAVITWWPASASTDTMHPLFELSEDSITTVTVTGPPRADADPEQVELDREQGSWKIGSAGGYPADATKVDEVLDKLLNLKVHKPIATQKANHNALQVGDDKYGKKVTLAAGDQKVELVLGAATSDSVNVRVVGQDDVYQSRGFSVWSIGESGRRYYDAMYLDSEADDVRVLTIGSGDGALQLDQVDGHWTSAALTEGEALDQDEVVKLVKDLVKIRISDPIGSEIKPAYGLEPGTKVEWTTEEEDQTLTWGYTVGAADEGKVYLKGLDNPFVVQVRKARLEELAGLTLDSLLVKGEAE